MPVSTHKESLFAMMASSMFLLDAKVPPLAPALMERVPLSALIMDSSLME